MLVDNGVEGDSRVQKVAWSAAEAGWDVTLLGRSPSGQAKSWKLGRATVRLLRVSAPLAKPRREFRRSWLRAPLAYPPTGIAAYRAQWIQARRADLAVRTAAWAAPTAANRDQRGPGGRLRLKCEILAAKVMRRWILLRVRQLAQVQPIAHDWRTRAYTWFWQKVQGDRSWRRLFPHLWDYELAYGPVVDKLAPDLIHAHDFRMLGVAVRAAVRASAKGHQITVVWDAHEYVPGVRPPRDNKQWLVGNCAYEREYAPHAHSVITVSSGLAELLQKEHKLTDLPTVVLNAPDIDEVLTSDGSARDDSQPDLRARCGVGPDVPLLVYSGAAAEQRGLGIMVEALPQLADVHVAFVVNKPDGPYVRGLVNRATELGVADRLTVLPYVGHRQVVPFLAGADIGVIPIHHWPNHEIALITKFFEYSHARLPIVVSDVRTMADTVRSTGQGEVFRAEDTADFIRAVRLVLHDHKRYQAVYDSPGLLDGWTWRAQSEILLSIYNRLLGRSKPAMDNTTEFPKVDADADADVVAAGVVG